MQTRKRAKSVSFGKSNKEKEKVIEKKAEEKIETKAIEEKVEEQEKTTEQQTELSHAAKKVQDYETSGDDGIIISGGEKPSKEEVKEDVKEEPAELSSGILKEPVSPDEVTTPTTDLKPTEVTPPSDFLSDATTVTPVSPPVEEKTSEPLEQAPIIVEQSPTNDDAIITPAPEVTTAEASQVTPQADTTTESGELSPTPPSSAFTLQDTNGDSGGGKRKNVILYFLLVAFLSFALGLGVMAAISHFGLLPNKLPNVSFDPNVVTNLNPMKPSPTPVPTKAPTPTPTEKPVDIKAYKITVLNGSGIKGKAAEVRTTLTTAGFTVVTAANADRSDYLTTQVVAKKSVPQEYLDKLEAELKKSFEVDTLSSMPNEANQSADVIITIGKKAAN